MFLFVSASKLCVILCLPSLPIANLELCTKDSFSDLSHLFGKCREDMEFFEGPRNSWKCGGLLCWEMTVLSLIKNNFKVNFPLLKK